MKSINSYCDNKRVGAIKTYFRSRKKLEEMKLLELDVS